MAIITVSREFGSLGTQIAESLCRGLGYTKLDKESLEILLRKLGMSPRQFERHDERMPGFWEKLSSDRYRYLNFLKAALYRFAAEQDCVILGRGANLVFRDVPGTLRLRIVACPMVRVARVRERYGINEALALQMIRESDRDRAGYQRYFFEAAWDAPSDYDLVFNTSRLSAEEACGAVMVLVRSPEHAKACERAPQALRDLRIAQDVVMAVVYCQRAPIVSLEAVCREGVVELRGVARSFGAIDECVAIARTVQGVTEVASSLTVVEYPISENWRH